MTDARDLSAMTGQVNRKRSWTMRRDAPRAAQADKTRARLLKEARRLFSSMGFHPIGVRDITEAANVTRGALAHHFGSKEDLFKEVFLEVEREIADATAHRSSDLGSLDAIGRFRSGVDTYLDAALRTETQRITFIDGPAVLGWHRWRELEEDFYLGMMTKSLARAADEGIIAPIPIRTLAAMIFGSVTEAALMIAHATDPTARRKEVSLVLDRMFEGLRQR